MNYVIIHSWEVIFILSTLSSHSRMRGSPDSEQAYPLTTISASQLIKVSLQSGKCALCIYECDLENLFNCGVLLPPCIPWANWNTGKEKISILMRKNPKLSYAPSSEMRSFVFTTYLFASLPLTTTAMSSELQRSVLHTYRILFPNPVCCDVIRPWAMLLEPCCDRGCATLAREPCCCGAMLWPGMCYALSTVCRVSGGSGLFIDCCVFPRLNFTCSKAVMVSDWLGSS
jgi:hypothetical protein